MLEGRLLLSTVPIGTQLPPALASAVLTDSPVLAEVGAVHDKVFAALQNLPLVASALDSVSNGLSDNIKSLGTEITTALNTLNPTMAGISIQTALTAGLGAAGLDAGTLTVQLDDSSGGNTPDQVNMGLEFEGDKNTANGMISNTGPTTVGTYSVFAEFDGNNDYNGVGSFNAGKSVVITPLSPLQPITSGKIPKGTLVSGQKITPFHFTFSLSNGSANTVGGLDTVSIVLSGSPKSRQRALSLGTFMKSVTIKGNKKGAFGTATIKSLPAGLSGTYFVVALLTDASMDTGIKSLGTINIAAPFTDLAAVSLAIPPKVRWGKTLAVTLGLAQHGNIPFGGGVPVELFLSASRTLAAGAIDLGLVTKGTSIKPGKKGMLHLSATIASSTAPGKYFVIASIDPANTLNDTNEGNNIISSVKMVTIS